MAVIETDAPIECRNELAAWLEEGSKPESRWRIGTEHEKFVFRRDDHSAVPYEGEAGIRALLCALRDRFGWSPIMEGETIIGLSAPKSIGGAISLEPGGQFELSGAPLRSLHETCEEVHAHLAQVKEVADGLDIGFLGLGFTPNWARSDIPQMPKGRYDIMTRYMPKVGGHGLDMMYRTCTVQVNLDFRDEADMIKKLRVSLALQPVATALFANSPFVEGKPSGYLSTRAQMWMDTDPHRTGALSFAFEPDMGFERYVDYALDVPMYLVAREGRYIDVAGASFRDFLDGKLAALPGERPTLADWENHLGTLFPDVRLKRFLEMRGADGGQWRRLCALPALWVGALYDQASLDAAWDLVKDWTTEDRERLREDVPRLALGAEIGGRPLASVAADFVEISRAGLRARARTDGFGDNEEHFLNAVEAVIEEGRTPAEEMLEKFHGPWKGSIDPVFEDYAY